MRLIATRQGLLPAPPATPAPAARRSWLKGLGAALGAALLARPTQASPTQVASDPSSAFIGEIMLVPYNFAPQGWLDCNGSLLSTSEYDVLFNLIGNTYGGDGVNTFAVPDLRGRAPIHRGQGPGLTSHAQGQAGGDEYATQTTNRLPAHTHGINNSGAAATSSTPTGLVPAVPAGTDANGETVPVLAYAAATTTDTEATSALAITGENQRLDLRSGLRVLRYCIATTGIYPQSI